jgi:hypothetical protein
MNAEQWRTERLYLGDQHPPAPRSGAVEYKAASLAPAPTRHLLPGGAKVILAHLETVDRDRDILDRGSMRPAAHVVLSAWNHSALHGGEEPVGFARRVREEGDKITAEIVFFDTPEGRRCCEKVQREAPDFSFGLRNIETRPLTDDERRRGALRAIRRFELYEVSPVVKGASVASGTAHACCGSCATGAGKCSTTPEEPKDSPDFEFFPEWQRDLLEKVRGRVKLAKVNEAVEMNRGRQLLQEIKASLARIEGDL